MIQGAQGDQFGRVARLAVADREWEGLRLQFTITKTTGREPNKSRIAVFNLDPVEAERVIVRGAGLRFVAGYDGAESTLFLGHVASVSSMRDVGISTMIDGLDGRVAMERVAARQWPGGTDWRRIVLDLANDMGVAVSPVNLGRLSGSTRWAFTVTGRAHRDLDQIVRDQGLRWTIHDGELLLIRPGQAAFTEAIVLDGRDVRAPERLDPTKTGRSRIRVMVPLQPRITSGALLECRFRFVRGRFRVDRVTHEGDTHGDQWTTEAEATEIVA